MGSSPLLNHLLIFVFILPYTNREFDRKAPETMSSAPSSIYDFIVKDADGKESSMEKYKGFVTIVVNVASKCGFTDNNYVQLQELYNKYAEKGLRIAAFPCNQFGSQEPKDACEVKKAMGEKYNVTFDIYDKVNVNGANASPLFQYLKEKQNGLMGNFIKWNFTKFLVDRNGQPINRYSPQTKPNDMESDILKALEQK